MRDAGPQQTHRVRVGALCQQCRTRRPCGADASEFVQSCTDAMTASCVPCLRPLAVLGLQPPCGTAAAKSNEWCGPVQLHPWPHLSIRRCWGKEQLGVSGLYALASDKRGVQQAANHRQGEMNAAMEPSASPHISLKAEQLCPACTTMTDQQQAPEAPSTLLAKNRWMARHYHVVANWNAGCPDSQTLGCCDTLDTAAIIRGRHVTLKSRKPSLTATTMEERPTVRIRFLCSSSAG